jgi:hypothetical protein
MEVGRRRETKETRKRQNEIEEERKKEIIRIDL